MRQPGSTSVKTSQSAVAEPLIAVVRLLARQAAAEFAAKSPPPAEDSKRQAEDHA
jgi:hypothetical protein